MQLISPPEGNFRGLFYLTVDSGVLPYVGGKPAFDCPFDGEKLLLELFM